MDVLSPNFSVFFFLVASVFFILGLKDLATPGRGRRGNRLAAFGAAIALVTVLISADLDNVLLILAALVVGAVLAFLVAQRGRAESLVLLSGLGGAAVALAALVDFSSSPVRVTQAFGFLDPVDRSLAVPPSASLLAYGAAALLGSLVLSAALATQRKLRRGQGRPAPAGLQSMVGLCLAAAIGLLLWTVAQASFGAVIALAVVGLVGGVLLAWPVDVEDVPVLVRLIDALAGLAVVALGFLVGNLVLLVVGALVASAALVLARSAAQADGRSLGGVLRPSGV